MKLEEYINPRLQREVSEKLTDHMFPTNGDWENDCYVWYGNLQKGDGQFYLSKSEVPRRHGKNRYKGKYVSARKLSYLLYYKSIPPYARIETLCGKAGCFNPKHLTIDRNPAEILLRSEKSKEAMINVFNTVVG